MKRRTLLTEDMANIRVKPAVSDHKILTFDDGVRALLADTATRGKSVHTVRYYKDNLNVFKRYMIDVENEAPPVCLTERHIERFVYYRTNTLGKSLNACNIVLRALKRYSTYLHDIGVNDRNPFDNITMSKSKTVEVETFTYEQINRLLSVIDTKTFVGYRDYVMVMLMLDTGVRLRELTDIKMNDVNFEDNYIHIFGKNQEYRNVPLGKSLKAALKKYENVRGYTPSDRLFISQNDTALKGRSIQERLRAYGILANITDVRCSPHTFRHTFAKMYLMNGGSIFALQDILGHKTLEMVRVYVRLYSPELYRDHSKFSPLTKL